jgi:hypothetical protein
MQIKGLFSVRIFRLKIAGTAKADLNIRKKLSLT